MQSVLFRVMNDVVLQVDSLDGVLAPSQKKEAVSLDDKNSFSFKVQQATTSISSTNLTALVNDFILPRAKTSLKKPESHLQSRSVDPGERGPSQVGGRSIFRDSQPARNSGRQHAHASGNLTVAGVIHQDVLDALGIKISKVAQPKRKQSFQIEGNDIVFPIDQMFPPPHVSGQLHDINISGTS